MELVTDEWEPPEELERQAAAEGLGQAPARPTLVPDRVPLYNLDAEASLLGAALIPTNDAIDQVSRLNPTDFGNPAHQLIAGAIAKLAADNQPIDHGIVADHLAHHGQLDLAGGQHRLLELLTAAATRNSLPRLAQIVRQYATLRTIGAWATELAAAVQAPGSDPSDLASVAQRHLDAIHERTSETDDHLAHMRDLAASYIDELERRDGQDLAGITTGLHDFDEATGGLQDGRLYTIAGRPGMGKSDVGVHLAATASEHGRSVLVVSIEMGHHEVLDRLVARYARLPATTLAHGHLGARAWERIAPAVSQLAERNLWIDDNPGANIAAIRASARRSAAQLIIVDYLQIVDTPGAESRQLEVSALARALKRLARDLDVPVVALAQLNRSAEARYDKRPMLSDLRESGAIEQESDVVVGLYRDEKYHRDSADRGVMELLLLKNRTGPETTVRVGYQPDVKQILNLAKEA